MKLKHFLFIFVIFLFTENNTLFAIKIFEAPKIVQLLQEKKNIIESIIAKYKNLPNLEDEIPILRTDLKINQVTRSKEDYSLLKITHINPYLRISQRNNIHLDRNSYNSNTIMDLNNKIETNKVSFNDSFRFLENNQSNKNISTLIDIINQTLNIQNEADRDIENIFLKKNFSKISTNNKIENNSKLDSEIKESLQVDKKKEFEMKNQEKNKTIVLKIANLSQTQKTFQNISSFKDFPIEIRKEKMNMTEKEIVKNSKKNRMKFLRSRIILPSSLKNKNIFANNNFDIPKYFFFFK